MRRLKKELSEKEYGKLKGAMWALRKKEEKLDDEEKQVLKCLFGHSPELEKAYNFRRELTDIFEEGPLTTFFHLPLYRLHVNAASCRTGR